MSPMTAMSTEAPSSFRGVPPTKWEHIKVETVRTVRKDARCSSPSGKAPRVGGEDEAPAAHKLLRKSSSFGELKDGWLLDGLYIPVRNEIQYLVTRRVVTCDVQFSTCCLYGLGC